MSLIGWDPANWHWHPEDKRARPSNSCMISMAGNAFSGFAVAPVLAAGLAVLGLSFSEKQSAADGEDADSDYDAMAMSD